MGGENSERSRIGNLGGVFGRGRSLSNVSSSSASSLASGTSENSAVSLSSTPNGSQDRTLNRSDSNQFLNVKYSQRSRSHSRGRKSSQGSIGASSEDSRSSQRPSQSGHRSMGHQGPIYQILNNFKPFSRDGRDSSRHDPFSHGDNKNSSPSGSIQLQVPPNRQPLMPQSPSHSGPPSRRSMDMSSTSDSDDSFFERGRKIISSHHRHSSERSESPSHRRLKILPSLSNLVPSSNSSADQSGIAGSARRVLGRRSRSSSRTKIDEISPMDTSTSNTLQPALPQQAGVTRRRRSSSATLKSHINAAGDLLMSVANPSSSKPTPDSQTPLPQQSTLPVGSSLLDNNITTPESESIRHMDLPTTGTGAGTSNLPTGVTGNLKAVGVFGREKGPPGTQEREKTGSESRGSNPSILSRDRTVFLRVYRPDGTFGTIACPIDISAERLLQLAARKFFITDAYDYHLVALRPEGVRILSPDAKPALLIRDLLIHAGYHSTMDRLNDISRDDTSFLCRIVLSNINEPLRPPLLTQSLRDLILVDTDVIDAPSLACPDARHVESLDVSRSAFLGTSTIFPRLRDLKLSRMFLMSSFTGSSSPQLLHLMINLTRLDLSCSGISKLDGIDFMAAPNLKHLDLRGNQLVSLPPSLLHLPFLEVLLCGTNSLIYFDTWNPSLSTIDLSYNKFHRLLLKNEQALQMVNLETLQLCANSLDSLPESLHLLPALKELDVRHNMIMNPMEAMTTTLHKFVASYNNPRIMNHRESSTTSSRDANEPARSGTKEFSNIRHLKLEGLHTLEIHETFSMANLTSLDMRNTHMPYVHESLFQNLPNLQALNLSNNSLTRLPQTISDTPLLEELYVSNNSLVDLPAVLFELPELRILDAHANNLKLLPPRIMMAPKLRILNLASNLISSLPDSISATNTSSLVQLTLCDNQLTEDCFEVVLQLTTLRILDLSYNFITELPSGVFSQLPLLEELYLSGNRIATLPHDDFLYATQLRVLRVNGNKLHTLPAELSKASKLEVLDAAANQLRYNVANWPFDWNWRWNQKLRYLNFSSNRRLEIRKSPQYIDDRIGIVDLADLCVLPKLTTLGLMDVTLTTNAVPFQTENCRVRTFGSDLQNFRVGIAECLGFRPLAINDLVVERFRNREDEFLVAMFDGQNEFPGSGNKISHLAQDTFASLLKREMQAKDTKTVDALRRAFLSTHREIGNTALLSSEEIAHTSLGHRNSTASRLGPMDWSAGTGATVVYFQGKKFYIATVGGARVVLSRSNGTHTVLSKPLPPVSAELDRIRSSGGIVDPGKSHVNGMSGHPRLIGCYTAGTVFSAAPSIYEYEFEALNVTDQIIIGSGAMWEVMRHETAADIVRSSAQDPVIAATKLRDFTVAYGMRDRMMAMVIGRPWSQNSEALGRQLSSSELYEDEMVTYRKRRQSLPEDSTLARLGTEVSPPFGEITMVFTDIKNSTYLWESYPSVMRAAIKTHNSLMRRSIRLMDGYEVKNEGDAFIISFHTSVKALVWCLTVQQHLLTAEWPPELLEVDECSPVCDDEGNAIFRGLSVRMGIHCGRPVAEPDPVTKRMDYFGPMVNRASRISGIALGGQISVSADFLNMLQRDLGAHKRVVEGESVEDAYSFTNTTTAAALERSAAVLDHIEYVVRELGELKLRGIENPEHIYNIYPVSLASREKFFNEHDTGERQSHAEIHPVIVSRADQGSTGNIGSVNPLSPVLGADAPAGSLDSSVVLGGGSSVPGLTGLVVNGSEPLSIPGSPFIPPLESDRRPSDGVSLSNISNRSFDNSDVRDSRVKHSLHTRPIKYSSSSSEDEVHVDPSILSEQLQNIAKRLEAICLASSSGLRLEPVRQILSQMDAPSPVQNTSADIGQLLWLTRIENSVSRLFHQF